MLTVFIILHRPWKDFFFIKLLWDPDDFFFSFFCFLYWRARFERRPHTKRRSDSTILSWNWTDLHPTIQNLCWLRVLCIYLLNMSVFNFKVEKLYKDKKEKSWPCFSWNIKGRYIYSEGDGFNLHVDVSLNSFPVNADTNTRLRLLLGLLR